MQESCVEFKKRKLSLKNAKTSKHAGENEYTSFPHTEPLSKKETEEHAFHFVDIAEDRSEILSDKRCSRPSDRRLCRVSVGPS